MPAEAQEMKLANLEWATLNMHSNSDHLDFQRHSYDLIIASDMLRTSANVRGLTELGKSLRPNGRLVVQEIGFLTQWVTYVFGSRLAWWCQKDTDGPKKQLAAVGLELSREPIGGDMQYLFTTVIMTEVDIQHRSLLKSSICREAMPLYDEPASMITEEIVTHLKENGYRVSRSTLESRALTGQDIISVKSLDEVHATVSVVYDQQWR